jgi:hypothetical protein
MNNNKIKNKKNSWRDWIPSTFFLKTLLIFTTLFIMFFLAVFVIWKRYSMRDHNSSNFFSRKTTPLLEQLEAPRKPISEPAPQGEAILVNRVAALETKATEQQKILKDNTIDHQQILQIPQKLIAVEILRAVLEGLVPLEILKTFLQEISEPWAHSLLATLALIKSTITYPQLVKELLVLPPPHPLSIWERVKATIKSFVRIRKLDEKGAYKLKPIENIQKSLEEHEIQKALELFELLSPQDKALLSSWKVLAQKRQALENSIKNILLELAESPKM